MSTEKPRTLVRLEYDRAAEAYLRSLPPEHFMEAVPQAKQRETTVESLALVKARRSDVQTFNELLVQYRLGREREIRQVVPDNMVVIHEEPIQAVGSYALELQPARPFWVMEYVSKSSQRKDYEDSFRKYERELKVPYYLLFYPDEQELSLFWHNGRRYRSVTANENGRYPIPELDLELGLLDGWVRFWFRGELLPLPADLQRELEEARRQLVQEQEQTRRAQEQARHAEEKARHAEEKARHAEEKARHAEEKARHAEEQTEHERQQKERLLAQLRELGIDPQ
jgi:Uma2 family endonuclease